MTAGAATVADRGALPADALELAAALRETLARACPPAAVRAWWPGGDPVVATQLWRQLAGSGLLALCVPEEKWDGLGLSVEYLAAAMEEVGYAGLPGPVIETAAVVAPVLADADADAVAPEYLARMLSGQLRFTYGRADQVVPHAQTADVALIRVGHRLRLIDCAGAVRPVATVDGARRSGLIEGGAVIVEFELSDLARRRARERAMLAAAAQLVGLAQRMLDLTVDYVKTREQFGRPLGSFQAVKHSLADAALAVEFARPMVHRAARSMTRGDAMSGRDVAAAKARASDLADVVSRRAIQCHGAMAYTTEYDLHLFAKNSWALAADWGGAADHRDVIAQTLGI